MSNYIIMIDNRIFVIFIFFIIIILFLKYRNTELYKNYHKSFFNDINSMPKKRNILILSAGPSLNEIYVIKKYFTKEFLKNTYVICIKSAINKAKELNIPVDFMVTNGIGQFYKIKKKNISKNTRVICLKDHNKSHSVKNDFFCDYRINLKHINSMECVINDEDNCIKFYEEDNMPMTHWGHVMMELALPLALMLKPKNIFTLGWDITYKNLNQHNYFETFVDYQKGDTIKYFSSHLSKYLKKHYKVNIFKLSKYSGVKIPYFNLNKHF